ncbi:unnamed protein product [Phytophthora fragariaefolia]|uniref:Unnamed protein product n=1 Tax=Phytophthora fragariaefolia TaxID=1490495 RepID=A0A9W6Y5B3_9STRA|nr:unnamed protein product [Phytophthora fragariaefolia]
MGLGACLMQDSGDGWQPVAYASKVNSTTEANYGITELECLAVVWAIKLFRPYLYGRRFTIITDHSALKWLMSSPNLTGILHRWALALQERDFDVQYRPGATNVVADALSRAPTPAVVLAAIGRRRRAKERKAARLPSDGTMETNCSVADDMNETENVAVARDSCATDGTSSRHEQMIGTRNVDDEGSNSKRVASDKRPLRGREVRRKRVTWASDIGGDGDAGERREQGVVRRGGDERGQPAKDVTSADNEDAHRTAQGNVADDDASATRASKSGARRREACRTRNELVSDVQNERMVAKLTREQRASMPRMEALRRTRAESREMTQMTIDAVMSETNEGVASSAKGRTPMTKTMGTAFRDQRRDERRRVGPILGRDRVEMRMVVEQNGEANMTKASNEYAVRQTGMQTLQLTDEDIVTVQRKRRLVQRLLEAGEHKGMKVERRHNLVLINTADGRRVVLPPELWPVVVSRFRVGRPFTSSPYPCANCASILVAGAITRSETMGAWMSRVRK